MNNHLEVNQTVYSSVCLLSVISILAPRNPSTRAYMSEVGFFIPGQSWFSKMNLILNRFSPGLINFLNPGSSTDCLVFKWTSDLFPDNNWKEQILEHILHFESRSKIHTGMRFTVWWFCWYQRSWSGDKNDILHLEVKSLCSFHTIVWKFLSDFWFWLFAFV